MLLKKAALHKKLLNWYDHNKRRMPWRKNTNPYRIWISEMMLQQTQVETVIPYFNRWMKTFPTIQALASSSLDSVLKHWEGLGYYSRARNIYKTATILQEHYKGHFPQDISLLMKLPGIGRYSACAIASIAFNQPHAVLDGNVIRVYSRLFLVEENTSLPATKTKLWEMADQNMAENRPGDFNQALMELGATCCTPRKPTCLLCPLKNMCRAHREDDPEKFPLKTKTQYEKLDVAIGIIWKNGKVLIQKRPEKGRMGGLWEFPGGKVEKGESVQDTLIRELNEELSVTTNILSSYKTIQHAYTKFRVTLHPFNCQIAKGKPTAKAASEFKWVLPSELETFAFPSANKKLIPKIILSGRQLIRN